MKSPLPIALAFVAIAVVVLWFAAGAADGPEPQPDDLRTHASGDVDRASSALPEPERTEQPRVVDPSPAPALQLEHPHAFTLRVRAVDEFGLPQGDRRVRIAPLGCTQNVMEQRTDDFGRAVVEWKGREKTMRMGLALGRGPLREIHVESGTPCDIVGLVPRDSGGMSFTIVSRGDGADGFVIGGSGGNIAEQKLQLVASTEPEDSIEARGGLHPHFRFSDRLLEGVSAPASPQALDALPLVGRSFRSVMRSAPRAGSTATAHEQDGNVTGIVFGPDGKPAAQQLVALMGDTEAPLATTRSDETGAYRFRDVKPGPARVRAGGQRMGLAEQSLVVGGVGATTVNVHLQTGQRIEGSATGRNGAPLRGWIVEYEALDGHWVDRALVRDDGAFTLPNLPGGAAKLLLRENSNAVPTAIVASVLPDSGAVKFDLSGESEPKGAIALRLPERAQRATDAAAGAAQQTARGNAQSSQAPIEISFGGTKVEGSNIRLDGSSFRLSNVAVDGAARSTGPSVRAWQVESGFCFSIPRAEDGSFTCSGLRAGYYRIEVCDVGYGTVDLGQHYVDGRSALDLGLVQLPRPGVLRLVGRKPGQIVELYHRRPSCDVRAVADLGERDQVELPAGTWILAYRTGEEPPKFGEVALEPGAEKLFDLTAR